MVEDYSGVTEQELRECWDKARNKLPVNTGSINVDKWLEKITKISFLPYEFIKHTETITTLSQNRV